MILTISVISVAPDTREIYFTSGNVFFWSTYLLNLGGAPDPDLKIKFAWPEGGLPRKQQEAENRHSGIFLKGGYKGKTPEADKSDIQAFP